VVTDASRSPTAEAEWQRRWFGLFEATEGTGIGPDLPTRSLIFDCLVAAIFFGMGSVFLPLFFPQAQLIDLIFVGLVNLPLMLRRRLPRVSFLLVQGFGLAQIWAHSPIGLHDGGMLFSLYSVVGFTNRRTGLVAAIAMLIPVAAGAVTDWWNFIDEQLMPNSDPGLLVRVGTTSGMLVLVLASWASGERLRSARLLQVALADRADQLERERNQQAQIAAAAERTRIAREMHDVIAHGLSVMIAQADGAAYVIERDPQGARAALERISATGRDSLTQMRGLLGLLRGGEEPTSGASVPQPGLAQLDELIEEAERTGLRVELRRSGDGGEVDSLIGLTIYRLLQECLTNARKHGGDHLTVGIDIGTDGTRLDVLNDRAPSSKILQTGAPGHGLQGMRERATAVGGQLEATETTDGFRVRAWLPHRPDTVGAG
jgi:signal transduction histidine kinase